jgi:hypothetical protein
VATLERLRTLDAAELRFRLTTELRKTGGRMRAAVVPQKWARRDLASLLRGSTGQGDPLNPARHSLLQGEWTGAHRNLAAHFSSRAGAFPLNVLALPRLREEITARFPDARSQAIARADQMLAGRYDLLGYRDVPYGAPPEWHRDPVHDRQPPLAFWSVVPYLDPAYGDHKVIWEINRHQHWLAFGRAHQLSGDRRYYDGFVAQLENWLASNAPLQGVNWASMLELGLRSISWIWALHFFAPAAVDDAPAAAPWSVDLLLGMDRQLTHIEHNLSRYFSPNTHLSGEALALYVAGMALPELAASARRARLGRQVLLEEIDRQINADGGHTELSAHYHRYSTDFYLLAALVARRSGDEAAPAFEEAARRQARYLRTIADDAGRLPLLGDDDGGQLFPVCGREASDCRDTLWTAAVIVDDPSLVIGSPPEETLWLCGIPVLDRPQAATAGSQALPASGYYVSRTAAGDHLIFDAGRHGYLNGGHAHADALSVVLTRAGRPFLVDAGTGTYTMDAEARDRFRSTAIHNTVVFDGQPASRPRGPFHWASTADARCVVWHSEPHFDFVEGVHDGYLPRTHARAIFALHGIGWIVLDHLLGPSEGSTVVDAFWHVHPDWKCTTRSTGVLFEHRDGIVSAMESTADLRVLTSEEATGLDAYAPVYGRLERSLCLRARVTSALPKTVATFITAIPAPALASIREVPVAHVPGPQWHGSAFRLTWCGQDAIILAAVEQSPDRVGARARASMWGTDLAQTDARAAVIQLSGSGLGAPVLVHSSRAELATGGVRRA